ncbi:hypothetical protein L6164_002075 [Bauhinia variegata]|uniref:Uncharacterized protein n=1 Tax=Bauhinia variegata TaxID=167791 RepID=A0ACB9PZU6_BAUVA|nr:hypothetical protein L6164_002075 [Bauhinia variegata]
MHEMVFETYEQMENYGFVPNTFAHNVVMDILFKIGRVDLSLKVLKENQVPNFLTFNIDLVHLSKLNDVSHIRHVLRVMLRMGLALAGNHLQKMAETGCSPNVVTYTTLIKAFMESKKVSEAFCFLKAMECSGHVPDLILCNVLIDCLSKVGRYQDAIEVFLSLSKQNIAPDAYTFSFVLSTICLSRRFTLLPKLVGGHIIDADLVFFNSLLRYFCKAGFPSLAMELYNDMIDRGFTPDKCSFARLLSGLFVARRVDEAVDLYHGILVMNNDVNAHIHTIIIDGLIKVGKFHSAIRIFRKAMMEKFPLDIVSIWLPSVDFLELEELKRLAHYSAAAAPPSFASPKLAAVVELVGFEVYPVFLRLPDSLSQQTSEQQRLVFSRVETNT